MIFGVHGYEEGSAFHFARADETFSAFCKKNQNFRNFEDLLK